METTILHQSKLVQRPLLYTGPFKDGAFMYDFNEVLQLMRCGASVCINDFDGRFFLTTGESGRLIQNEYGQWIIEGGILNAFSSDKQEMALSFRGDEVIKVSETFAVAEPTDLFKQFMKGPWALIKEKLKL